MKYQAIFLALLASGAVRADLNGDVLRFCEQHRGKKVGSGECAALAMSALRAAKARTTFPENPGNGDYVWGKRICTIEIKNGKPVEIATEDMPVQPGDIVQFRSVKFVNAKGVWSFYKQHTAVIQSATENGKRWKVLHQNVGAHGISEAERRTVKEDFLNLKEQEQGVLRVYRPLPR